jgi:uncharacterized protein YfiM (DUF2279 family)
MTGGIMKKIGIVIFAAALIVGIVLANFFSFGRTTARLFNFSTNFGGIAGSGNIVTDKRDVSDFRSIEVGGIFKVEVTAQKEFSVEVVADDNLLPIITTEVDGGVLKIGAEKHIKSHGPILIRISAPDIKSIDASGASAVNIADMDNAEFSIESSGASKITASGKTQKLTVDVSGASRIGLEDLSAVDANVDASGASHVDLTANSSLVLDASGASRITYSGDAKNIEKKNSGASSISPR